MKRLLTVTLFISPLFILVFVLEILFRWIVFAEGITWYHLRILMMSLTLLLPIGYILTRFKKRLRLFLMGLLGLLITIYYFAQTIYFKLMSGFMTIRLLGMADTATEFVDDALSVLTLRELLYIIAYLLFLLSLLFLKQVEKKRLDFMWFGLFTLASASISFLLIQSPFYQLGMVTDQELFLEFKYQELSMHRFGVLTYLVLDVGHAGGSLKHATDDLPIPIIEKEVVYDETDPQIAYWEELIETEADEQIKNLHALYASLEGKKENAYTGLFEGKNLILLLGEAFDQVSIHEEYTPTLYKMSTEGFFFVNHFAPMYSCATGESEFMALTSLLPLENVCTPNQYSENIYTDSLPMLFNEAGYYSSSYHNYYDKYYDRHILHPSLGFSQYLNRTGLDMEKLVKGWPSDEVMMERSLDDYIDKEPFFTFYVTVSGHFPYYDDATIILENWDVVSDMDAPYEIKKYIATQVELDRSLKYLMDELEKVGKLENTVFALFPDHYPFKLDKNLLNDFSNYSNRLVDQNINNVPMLIWTPDMKSETVTKYSDTLDVLPTLANLFNLDYDPRLAFGDDLFDDSDGLVVFRSSSWISDHGYYNALRGTFTPYDDSTVTKEEIDRINEDIKLSFELSSYTLELDYYKYLK